MVRPGARCRWASVWIRCIRAGELLFRLMETVDGGYEVGGVFTADLLSCVLRPAGEWRAASSFFISLGVEWDLEMGPAGFARGVSILGREGILWGGFGHSSLWLV